MTTLTFGAHAVDLAMPIAVLLIMACVLAMARLLYRQWRADPLQRSRPWRIALLVLAQPLGATLLYFALLPPTSPGEAGTLVVASAGATAAQLHAGNAGETLVALPEAPTLHGAERVPDLATALRRHPGTRLVRVVGAGLEARDHDALRGLTLELVPNPLPRGLVELVAPSRVAAGGGFRVHGRAERLRGGFAELLDPARQRVDRVALPPDGRFTLAATARVPGAASYRLRLSDERQQPVEDVELPLLTEVDPAPRVLVLAGAPGPELKYLRRWARDAGLALRTQIGAGGGLQLGDAPMALNAGNLARFDLVVLDERAWSALGDRQRAALDEAVRSGLGLLLRVTASLSDSERRRLRTLGFSVDSGRGSVTTRLSLPKRGDEVERARIGPGTHDAPRPSNAAVAEAPALTRRTLRVEASDALPLLRDDTGAPLGVWRPQGRGRVAVSMLTDSYRLVLAGRGDMHGELWSEAFATLARAQSRHPFTLEGDARQDQRIALCGVAAGAGVIAPDGTTTSLLADPATGTRSCAAFWPRQSGWHRLQSGDRSQLFHVRARDAAKGLHAGAVREATQRLAAESGRAARDGISASPQSLQPGPRWPWWLAWLLVSAGLWLLERHRSPPLQGEG